ncbi:MAG: nuclear transport factor 2 family protein [Blastocatellia bacterium]|nr:nuclear transport factor 2 family protein [Blastocatellia bacterium]
MKTFAMALMLQLASSGFSFQQSEANIAKEKEAIRNIVEMSYIDVLYYGKEIDDLKKGFHPEFNMYVLSGNKIDKRSLEQWMERLEAVRARRGATTSSDDKNRYRHEFKSIDVTDYTAVAKIEIFRDGKLEYTDYLTLYKFEEGWRVMTKFFTQHR